jgi:hypothetical protein
LRAGRRFEDARFAKLKKACRITDAAVDRLAAAIVAVLDRARRRSMTLEEIRAEVPARLVQSLGDAGKKLGDATTLPVALRRLVVAGEARRVPATLRLDAGRYAWLRTDPAPLAALAEEGVDRELAARFFAWAGPSTRGELAAWAGISQAAAKAAMATLELCGAPGDRWIRAQDSGVPRSANANAGAVHFLPFRDNYTYFHKASAPPEVSTHHLVLVGGEIAGMWEWESETRSIVWATRGRLTPSHAKQAEAAAKALEEFVRNEVGDVRVYALDNEKNRAKRLGKIREISRRARAKSGS